MSVSEIRKELHKAIDEIEDQELLQAMLTVLAEGKSHSTNYKLTDPQLDILNDREQKYLNGQTNVKTIEEFKKEMNKKYGV
jgi:hypothetical protein